MINLLPYKEKRSIEKIRSIRLIRMVVVGFIIVFIVGGLLLFPTLLNINSRFSLATNQIKSLEREGVIASDINIAELEQRAQKVQKKLSLPPITQPTSYINTVTGLVGAGVVIERFNIQQEKTLEVFGLNKTREGLQKFIKDIEADQSVASVDSPVSNFVKSKNSSFKITVKFK